MSLSPIYLSGPMSGLPDYNFPAFHAAARRLRSKGLEVVNPAELPHSHLPHRTWATCLRHDLEALVRCRSVAVLPGWWNSQGANLEVYVARKLGMPILDAQSLLPWGVQSEEWKGTIIGLLGAATVGKDTIQKGLGWPRAAFADALKMDLAPLFAQLGLDLSDPEHKKLARNLMVEHGRLGRALDPDYWIKRLFLPPERVCITDVRYWNEVRWIIGKGGQVFWIEREGIEPANEEERRSFREIEEQARLHHILITKVHNPPGRPEEAIAKIQTYTEGTRCAA